MSREVKIRRFTEAGLEKVRQLLEKIRIEGGNFSELVASLVIDKSYTKEVKCKIYIDLDKVFSSKLEMARYFATCFSEETLGDYKKDAALWTWIAFAYYPQLAKIKSSAEYCWIYDPNQYRYSRRHFIAGAVYLYQDFKPALDEEGEELFFSDAPNKFGGFIDAVTYTEEFARIPAMLRIATWLYYDANSKNKLKKGATAQKKPGTVRELTRMAAQFAMTYDIFDSEDASKLWKLLPYQFDKFKAGAYH